MSRHGRNQPPPFHAPSRESRHSSSGPLLQPLGELLPDSAWQRIATASSHDEQRPVSSRPEGWWEGAFSNKPTPSELRGHRCGESQMLTIVAYDITDHKRLAKIARVCEDYGVRVQYSVFECRLEADKFDAFWNHLLALIEPETDRLVAYKVCCACARDIRDAGIQAHHEKVVAYVF
jgi:CRISPR-associated protein Cas2